MNEKQSALKNIQSTWRGASPVQRFLSIGFLIIAILILSYMAALIFGGSNNKQELQEASSKIEVRTSQDAIAQANSAIIPIIEDKYKQAEINVIEQKKAMFEARQGKSVFQPLSASESIELEKKEKEIETKIQQQLITQKERERSALQIQRRPAENTSINNLTASTTLLDEKTKDQLTASVIKNDGANKTSKSDHKDKEIFRGMSPTDYNTEMKKRRERIKADIEKYNGLIKGEITKTSGGFKGSASPQSVESESSNNRELATEKEKIGKTGKLPDMPMLYQPGDYIMAYNKFPVDSRTNKDFVLHVVDEQLRDGRLSCTYSDNGEFLVPQCNLITFKGRVHKIQGNVINPDNFSGIVEQDIDNDGFLKTISRIGAVLTTTWGTEKLKSGIKITKDTEAGTTEQENTLSDKEILIGAAASSLGDLVGQAERYYQSSSVKTIRKETAMMIVFTKPMPDWWQLTKGQENDKSAW